MNEKVTHQLLMNKSEWYKHTINITKKNIISLTKSFTNLPLINLDNMNFEQLCIFELEIYSMKKEYYNSMEKNQNKDIS